MKNKVASLWKLLRDQVSPRFRDKPTGCSRHGGLYRHEVPPYPTISNSKEDKLEQIH